MYRINQGGSMRTVIAFAFLAFALGAAANPVPTEWPYLFVDFSGPPGGDYVPEIFPDPSEVVDCYVGMGCSDGEPDDSFRSVAFRLEYVGQIFPLQYQCLVPGAEITGWWDDYYGVEITTAECIDWTGPVFLVRVSILYLGIPTDVLIRDHPEKPRWVVDCNDELHFYCISGHGAIGKPRVPGDPECEFMCHEETSPVTAASWGAVKALYR
jgi:hypothetical protein